MNPCLRCGIEMRRVTELDLLRDLREKLLSRAATEFRGERDDVALFLRDVVVKEYVAEARETSERYYKEHAPQTTHTCAETPLVVMRRGPSV